MTDQKHTNFDVRLSKANLCAMVILVGIVWAGTLVVALSWRNWFSTQPPVDNVKSQTAREFIDPNTATVPSLQRLRGIGPAKAEAIVDYRKQHGPQAFKCAADLEKVRGIGPQTVKKNLGRLVFPSELKNEREQ
jgi:competence ComEA-like helix-hairpin-helix protein